MVSKTVLNNGITVLSELVPGFNSCSIGFWLQTGSRAERLEQMGLSHVIEHMLFKGTENRSLIQIAQEMDSVAGQMNAFTEKEHTCYYVRVIDRHFDLAWDVLSDMLLRSVFPKEELEREKGVILEEIAMYEDTPEDVAYELFHNTMWQNHPLGRPILGTCESVAAFTREDLLDYSRSNYTAERLYVSVAGNIQHEDIVQRVSSWDLPASTSPLDLAVGGVPVAHCGRIVEYRDDEQENLIWGVPGLAANDDRRYAMLILDSVLGGSMSCRLSQEIREKRGLAYSVGTFQNNYRDCGSFGFYAGTSPENAAEVVRLFRQVSDEVCQQGISEAELQRAKEFVKGTMALALEGTSARMMRLAKTESVFGRYVELQEVASCLDAVTRDEVLQVAREVLGGHPSHFVAVGPLRELEGVSAE